MGLADICVRFVGAERENNHCTTNLWQPGIRPQRANPGWTGDRKLGTKSLRSMRFRQLAEIGRSLRARKLRVLGVPLQSITSKAV